MLAAHGFVVHGLATTAVESRVPLDFKAAIYANGVCRDEIAARVDRHYGVLRFEDRNVSYTLVDTQSLGIARWPESAGATYDRLFDDELNSFRPDVLFTYGGHLDDRRRHHRAQLAGARVVFGVFSLGYLEPGFFNSVDAVLTPSRYMAGRYAQIGISSTPIATPLVLEDVLSDAAGREFVTIVNPAIEKGLMFAARLLHELTRLRPDIPILVVESRGTREQLYLASFAGGFDIRDAPVTFWPPQVMPKEIYARTRVLLVPSVGEEASSRAVAEALVNGIPPIVSDRGGLPENVGNGGFVIPLPTDLTRKSRAPVSAEAVRPWIDLITRLFRDHDFYKRSVDIAQSEGQRFAPNAIAQEYVRFFQSAKG
ncbi:MAG TPA: glycosyltransferase [Candidatus Cybelea sp.]